MYRMNLKRDQNVSQQRSARRHSDFVLRDQRTLLPSVVQKQNDVAVVQRNKDEHGLVPPQTHERSTDYQTPANPAATTKGHHHAVPRKNMTRFERMIDRIGRILATETNVHVAVALDDQTLVLSVNQESAEQNKKLSAVAATLRSKVLGDEDPLPEDRRVTGDRRVKDRKKTKRFLQGGYTDESSGIEANEDVRGQLARLLAAINAGVISCEQHMQGRAGIYVVPTSTHASDSSYNKHGELKVTAAIHERRKQGNYTEKDVYIGGTLADCFLCNASHKVMNAMIANQLNHRDWRFYSGGTHGGMFVGYRASKVVDSHRQSFNQLTGEAVVGGDIPKVNVALGHEPPSSFHDDSESEDEDAGFVSEYAKARNQLMMAKKQIRSDQKKLERLSLEIQHNHKQILDLTQELETAKAYIVSEEYQSELKIAVQEFQQNQAMYEKALAVVEQKKSELEAAQARLDDVQQKLMNDAVVVGKQGRKPKPGLDVEFRSERLGIKNWQTGKSMQENALSRLNTKYGYSDAYSHVKDLTTELSGFQNRLTDAGHQLEILSGNVERISAKGGGKVDKLSAQLEALKNKSTTLSTQQSVTQESLQSGTASIPGLKQTLKTEVSREAVQSRKGKFDWLNQGAIEHDAQDE